MTAALGSHLAALALDGGWGNRPRGPPPAPELRAGVLLNQDHQAAILDVLGVRGSHLAALCRSWRVAVAERLGTWRLLRRESSFGQGGRERGQLLIPRDVAALPEDALVVADTNNHRLQIFPKTRMGQNAAPRLIGGYGKRPGQFDEPCGVACDWDTLYAFGPSLYVSDGWSHRVQKLRLSDGEHLGTVGNADCSSGRGDRQFNFPCGLCVASGAVYVCDTLNHRIVVLGTDLSWRYTIGREGRAVGEFYGPTAVAAHDGELYSVDRGNNRIQVRAPQHSRLSQPSLPCTPVHGPVARDCTPRPHAGVRAGPPSAAALCARYRRRAGAGAGSV